MGMSICVYGPFIIPIHTYYTYTRYQKQFTGGASPLFRYQRLNNPFLRERLGMGAASSGVLITEVSPVYICKRKYKCVCVNMLIVYIYLETHTQHTQNNPGKGGALVVQRGEQRRPALTRRGCLDGGGWVGCGRQWGGRHAAASVAGTYVCVWVCYECWPVVWVPSVCVDAPQTTLGPFWPPCKSTHRWMSAACGT